MKRILLLLCIALNLTVLSSTTLGQIATASLRGVVTDATRAVVPGAEVVISSVNTAQQRIERTDSHGEFSFQELFVGDYRVEVRSEGFATWVNSRIHPGCWKPVTDRRAACSRDRPADCRGKR